MKLLQRFVNSRSLNLTKEKEFDMSENTYKEKLVKQLPALSNTYHNRTLSKYLTILWTQKLQHENDDRFESELESMAQAADQDSLSSEATLTHTLNLLMTNQRQTVSRFF